MNPQQPRREVLQEAQRHRLILDEDAVAPLARNLAPDHQLVVLDLDARLEKTSPQRSVAREDPRDRRTLGPLADEVARRACPGEKRQRVDHQRLAGSGLAGEHVQPGSELDLAPRQNRQISHAESAQHFRLRASLG